MKKPIARKDSPNEKSTENVTKTGLRVKNSNSKKIPHDIIVIWSSAMVITE